MPDSHTWPLWKNVPHNTPAAARSRSASSQHDVRRLAAELERHLLHGARRELHDAAADFGRTGERDLVDERVLRQLFTRAATGTGDRVDDAGRDVGFFARLHHLDRAQRREARGLQHARVAGRDRGRDLPTGHEEREVPRHDAAAHTERLAPHACSSRAGTGSRRDRSRRASFSAQSANVVNVPTAPGTSANIAFLIVPPPSRASISAISALRVLMISATLRSFSARSLPDIFDHGPSSNAVRGGLRPRVCRVLAPGLGDVGDLLARRRGVGRRTSRPTGRRPTRR